MSVLIPFYVIVAAFFIFMVLRPKTRKFDPEVARRVVNAAREIDDEDRVYVVDAEEDRELYRKWLAREDTATRV